MEDPPDQLLQHSSESTLQRSTHYNNPSRRGPLKGSTRFMTFPFSRRKFLAFGTATTGALTLLASLNRLSIGRTRRDHPFEDSSSFKHNRTTHKLAFKPVPPAEKTPEIYLSPRPTVTVKGEATPHSTEKIETPYTDNRYAFYNFMLDDPEAINDKDFQERVNHWRYYFQNTPGIHNQQRIKSILEGTEGNPAWLDVIREIVHNNRGLLNITEDRDEEPFARMMAAYIYTESGGDKKAPPHFSGGEIVVGLAQIRESALEDVITILRREDPHKSTLLFGQPLSALQQLVEQSTHTKDPEKTDQRKSQLDHITNFLLNTHNNLVVAAIELGRLHKVYRGLAPAAYNIGDSRIIKAIQAVALKHESTELVQHNFENMGKDGKSAPASIYYLERYQLNGNSAPMNYDFTESLVSNMINYKEISDLDRYFAAYTLLFPDDLNFS